MDFLSLLGNTITIDMNMELSRDFIAVEVYHVLKQMNPHKTPGSDGLTPMFHQRYWHIVGFSVMQAVLSSLTTS